MRLSRLLYQSLFSLALLASFTRCTDNSRPEIQFPKTDLAAIPFIPKPAKVIATEDAFGLDRHTAIYCSTGDGGLKEVAGMLSEYIKEQTGLEIPLNGSNTDEIHRALYLNVSDNMADEAYELYISRDTVLVNSGSAAGAFRAVQTFRQLIPEKSNDTLAPYPIWPLPSGKITDAPRYAYRGSMLDVSRHFFSVEDVKKYLDVMAYYKMNVLHLGLTNDQGWRIEIKSWPRLTEVGGSTEVGGGPGGFYTQEEYREIVAYAAARHITIVPEVDMPGHTNAASVSYPFLNGNGKTPELYTGTAVGFSTFDTRKDTVYAFIDDVVREIAEMSPGPYFHIGGDESHSTRKEDYVYFIERVAPIVRKYGKKVIGWDEVATARLDSTAIAQFWADEENAGLAVKQGMQVLFSPAKKAYLDMQYDSLSVYGLHWAAYIPVDTAYSWDPESYVPGIGKENILGIEAPLWSETISNMAELEYLAFPRLIGYAEIGWTSPELRDWEEYKTRLASQLPYLTRKNIQFYPSARVPWGKPVSELPWYTGK